MSAREEVLRAVRAAVQGAVPVDVPRRYRTAGERPPGDPALLELLTDRLVDYRATVRRAAPDEIPAAVAEALAEARTCVVPPGLDAGWTAGWDGRVVVDDPPLDVEALDRVDAVLTGARVAVAETGTVVLDSGPDTGRRAISLVPDHHVCVVRAQDVVATVPEALARVEATRPLTWVSGPSATSDIELSRVEGVHGPRRLDVVLVVPPVG